MANPSLRCMPAGELTASARRPHLLMDIRLAWNPSGYFLISESDGDHGLVVGVQSKRISRRNFHFEHLLVVVIHGEMVVWPLIHCDDIKEMRNERCRHQPPCRKPFRLVILRFLYSVFQTTTVRNMSQSIM